MTRAGEVLMSALGARQQRWLARFRAARVAPFILQEPEIVLPLTPHTASADIVVCIHDALEDVKGCLESVVRYTRMPYRLILVDDGSGPAAHDYLVRWASEQDAVLHRNEQARGYTRAANQGLRESMGDYVVLLNSDTLVTPDWLDRLIACAESDPNIGIVGPLSNTASWQSVPELLDTMGDWADNPLPSSMSPVEFALGIAASSARLYPRLAFLNGFCLLIKRSVIDEVGEFDEATFGQGYGEENDYCLRVRQTGRQLAVADDAYVYHAQSRSYSHERRRQLSDEAHQKLIAKHNASIVETGVHAARVDRVMAGIRVRVQVLPRRRALIDAGRRRWEGRRLLFLLPVREGGGGANVILQEAAAMQRMGVQVDIANLNECRVIFERGHPNLPMRVVWVDQPREIAALLPHYDAVVATYNISVAWMQQLAAEGAASVRGYYIQDFEPFFYAEHSSDYERALQSYTLYPDLVRVTKTAWNRATVKHHTGADSAVVGPSVAVDLFRPRRSRSPQWPERPLRIAAMIRPSSPRREPHLTMELLGEVSRAHGVEVVLFGCESEDPAFLALPRRFPWRNAGVVQPSQLASLFNEVDAFVDFSSFQAMGLTAMEAMACGLAVIVPQKGGTDSFARHEANCLVVDTESKAACRAALERLIREPVLRRDLGWQALHDMVQYHPEGAAFETLAALFPALPRRA
ncbi:MAG: glycosyltransferase [Anaerolineales bacterium]